MPPENFTVDEVNQMLENQAIKTRLDGIEKAITTMSKQVSGYMENDKVDISKVMTAIEAGSAERRESEAGLRRDLQRLDNAHHEKFVKKAELKVYAIIIIFAVTFTTGFIAWVGAQQASDAYDRSIDQILDRIG